MEMSVTNYRNINAHNRWGIIISSGLMAVTLIISLVLWLIFYHTNIDEILRLLNKIINKQGINFNLTFQLFTIFILIFAVFTLIIITIPFLFLTKYGVITLILSLVILLVSIIFLGSSGLLLGYGYQDFYDFVMSKHINDILFFVLPWTLAFICCLFLVIFCLWLIMANLTKKENKNKLVTTDNNSSLLIDTGSINKEQNSPFIEQTTVPAVLTERLPNENQGISITIHNITGSPLPQSKLIDPQVVVSNPIPIPITSTNNTSVNDEATWTSHQIEEVWNKGEIIENYNPQLYRKDYAGALMFKNSFINNVKLNDDPKNLNWTIIHQCPLSHGGTSDISNLQPMNNINAITKGNNYPRWKTATTFNGKQNILKQKKWKHKK